MSQKLPSLVGVGVAELLSQMVQAIIDATIIDDPFPHLEICPFVPADVYDDLLKNFPMSLCFVKRGAYGAGKTVMCQYLYRWSCWDTAVAVLQHPVFVATLCEKFGVSYDASNISWPLLHKDTHGYTIAPHADVPAKKITYIWHFATDEDHHELGTILVQPKPEARLLGNELHKFWYDFEPVKMAPYRPNALLVFAPAVTSDCYHAVDIKFAPDDPVQSRHSVRGFVFDQPEHLPFIFERDYWEWRYADDTPLPRMT